MKSAGCVSYQDIKDSGEGIFTKSLSLCSDLSQLVSHSTVSGLPNIFYKSGDPLPSKKKTKTIFNFLTSFQLLTHACTVNSRVVSFCAVGAPCSATLAE